MLRSFHFLEMIHRISGKEIRNSLVIYRILRERKYKKEYLIILVCILINTVIPVSIIDGHDSSSSSAFSTE